MTAKRPQSTHSAPQTVFLSTLLKHAVIDAKGKSLGELADAIVELRGEQYPRLIGLVARVGSVTVFVPMSRVIAIDSDRIELRSAKLDLRPFARRDGEVLLRADVLGHRLIDVDRATLVRAYDVQLTKVDEGWVVTGLDVHHRRFVHIGSRHERHPMRDWRSFEALIGHEPSVIVRSAFGRLRRLKPAQIADLIEEASRSEQNELLTQVHTDPELEADVFEELDEGQQAQLLRGRTTEQIADVLARMRADDAADAVMDLPQDRRQPVLDLLPEPQHTKVLTLLGYNETTAGGLMGMDYVAVPTTATVADALQAIREADTSQPEALASIYLLDPEGKLAGALSVITALQADAGTPIRELADLDPVHVHPEADIVELTTRMSDYNLLTLPVLDPERHILGVITVDDALEAAIPDDWRRREPSHRSSASVEPD
jgi:CBS domain-containing protein/sporulation protein YlmC with PRC-barrel domain